MQKLSNFKNQSKPIQQSAQYDPVVALVVEKAPLFEYSTTAPVSPDTTVKPESAQKLTEYKSLIADSYHSIDKVANALLALGFEVKHVVPVLSGKIVLLGGK
jgi:hypothetical protein